MTPKESNIANRLSAFKRRSVKWDDGAIGYYESGAGESVVLLHGIGSSSGSWLEVFERWHGRGRLIAWDAPGYGDSTHLAETSPLATHYAEMLSEFIQRLALQKPHIVGHSLGAIMAMSYAARHPDNLSSLMLLDPARGYGSESNEYRSERLSSRLSALYELGPRSFAEKRSHNLLSHQANEEALEIVKTNMANVSLAGYVKAAHLLAYADILVDAQKYCAPVLVACGAEDTVTPPALAKTIADALPNAVYREIPQAGHASYVERPEDFIALLTEWIEK